MTPADYLRAAFDKLGVTDPSVRAGIAAIAMGESGLNPHSEISYAHTDNDRIRLIFGSRVPADDASLDALKADPVAFFNHLYGNRFGNRPNTNDGYDYRGRGYLQHTFRGNYQELASELGRPDIVTNPDIVNDFETAAECAIAYIKKRWDGVDFESMLTCVGNNTADISATKHQFYQRFLASGEFSANAVADAAPMPSEPAMSIPTAKQMQAALQAQGLYQGHRVDGIWGTASQAALAIYYSRQTPA